MWGSIKMILAVSIRNDWKWALFQLSLIGCKPTEHVDRTRETTMKTNHLEVRLYWSVTPRKRPTNIVFYDWLKCTGYVGRDKGSQERRKILKATSCTNLWIDPRIDPILFCVRLVCNLLGNIDTKGEVGEDQNLLIKKQNRLPVEGKGLPEWINHLFLQTSLKIQGQQNRRDHKEDNKFGRKLVALIRTENLFLICNWSVRKYSGHVDRVEQKWWLGGGAISPPPKEKKLL